MPRRNELCPCGSGKKYKKCCLLKEQAKIKPYKKPKELKFEKINEGEVTEKQAKDVVNRMYGIGKYLGVDLYRPKERWWRRIKLWLKQKQKNLLEKQH